MAGHALEPEKSGDSRPGSTGALQDAQLDGASTASRFLSPECDDPFKWPTRRKWTVTLVAVLATFTTQLDGTILTVAHEAINDAFNVSDSKFPNSYWPVASWRTGGAIFSLIILPVLEDFGVRTGFLGTYLLFISFIIPQGLAQNFATLAITRFFAGGCVSILANTSASVIGNVWEDDRGRTIPMSLYITAYLAGISSGPVIGGIIFQELGWRWISYLQTIWYAMLFPVYYFLLAESRGSMIKHQGSDGANGEAHGVEWTDLFRKLSKSIQRPLFMLCTEPVLFVFTIWSAFAVGAVYLFTQSTEQVFGHLYDFTPSQAGFIQAAIVIGTCIGWSGVLVSKKLYFSSAKHNKREPGQPIPEARLYMSTIGSLVGITAGMFVYGWTSYPNIHWIAPAIGLTMVGSGTMIVVLAVADYVVDAYAKYAGSAVAAVVLVEDLVAAFLPLAAQSMYTNLGFQWASTVLGFVSLLLSCAPFVLIKWGWQLRERSPFMRSSRIETNLVA